MFITYGYNLYAHEIPHLRPVTLLRAATEDSPRPRIAGVARPVVAVEAGVRPTALGGEEDV